jgi:hypothetical protein
MNDIHSFPFPGSSDLVAFESHMTHSKCRSNLWGTVHGWVVLSYANELADR